MANTFKSQPTHTNDIEIGTQSDSIENSARLKKQGFVAKILNIGFGGNFLNNTKTLKQIPFIIFLSCLSLLYIANGFFAEDKIREENRLKNDIKEIRSVYISTKSDIMFVCKQSQVAKAVEALGLKESTLTPKVIINQLH